MTRHTYKFAARQKNREDSQNSTSPVRPKSIRCWDCGGMGFSRFKPGPCVSCRGTGKTTANVNG